MVSFNLVREDVVTALEIEAHTRTVVKRIGLSAFLKRDYVYPH